MRCPFPARHTAGMSMRAARSRMAVRGQSIVEFALVIPVFLFLVIGIIEVGVLYMKMASYQEAALQAARVVAASGISADADTEGLLTLQQTLGLTGLDKVNAVTIYDSTVSGGFAVTPPVETCRANNTPPACDNAHTTYVYSPAAQAFVCQETLQPPPCNTTTVTIASNVYTESYWNPPTRDDTEAAITSGTPLSVDLNAGLDHVGVAISFRYQSITGLIPSRTVTQTAETLMEPFNYAPASP